MGRTEQGMHDALADLKGIVGGAEIARLARELETAEAGMTRYVDLVSKPATVAMRVLDAIVDDVYPAGGEKQLSEESLELVTETRKQIAEIPDDINLMVRVAFIRGYVCRMWADDQ